MFSPTIRRAFLLRHDLASVLIVLAACSSPTDLPGGRPDADGTIITVFSSPNRVLIKGNEECGIVFGITSDTRLIRSTAPGGFAEATAADLKVGVRAQGWVAGFVAESCPAQAAAEAILLLP